MKVNWEICLSQRMTATRMRSCGIAEQLCPHGLALSSFVTFSFGLPPSTCLALPGPLCPDKYTYSPVRI